ncbi:hypothetical protein EPN87_01980 [archaeon]|nr:MAG: hypothetical protein EPN87_01980 [archaeon]
MAAGTPAQQIIMRMNYYSTFCAPNVVKWIRYDPLPMKVKDIVIIKAREIAGLNGRGRVWLSDKDEAEQIILKKKIRLQDS